jgi:hypothetical protein
MKPIYTVNVEIEASPLRLQRTFRFATVGLRQQFLSLPREGYKVTGYGIEHLMTVGEVLAEIKEEATSVDNFVSRLANPA